MRDEVRPDEAVRGVPAHEEAPCEQPEVARAHGLAKRRAPAILRPDFGRDHVGLADGSGPDVLRPVAHQQRDRREHQQTGGDQQAQGPAPALAHGKGGHGRDEDQLPGAGRATEEADDHAAVRAEPAVRHRRAEHAADRAGADPDGKPPDQIELPEIADQQQAEQAGDDADGPGEHHAARPETVDEGAAKRSAQPEGEDAERDGERDRRAAPPEL